MRISDWSSDVCSSDLVTVIDDDEDGCDEIMDLLREFNYEPIAVTGQYDNRIDDMVAAIESQDPDFVICDNRLQPRQMAQVYGVPVVKQLIKLHRPAMLLTTNGSPARPMFARSEDRRVGEDGA